MALVACDAVQDEAPKSRRLKRLACRPIHYLSLHGLVLLIKLARVEPRLDWRALSRKQ